VPPPANLSKVTSNPVPVEQHQGYYKETYGGVDRSRSLYQSDLIVPIDPAYIEVSNSYLPRDKKQTETQLQFACVVQPMSQDSQTEIPVVQFPRSCGVIRCRLCRAYLNPFVRWKSNGEEWACNLCNGKNKTPADYACGLNGRGERLDMETRKELSHSSVEILAPEEYTVRPPQDPAYIFLIHVHRDMIKSGALSHIVDSIRDHIDDLQGGERCRVMIITFDSIIHFYKCKDGAKIPQVLAVPDISQQIMPCPWFDCFVNRNQCKDLILKVLESLPALYHDTPDVGNCLGSAVTVAMRAAQQVGGKMMVFNWGRPNLGIGKLKDRMAGVPLDDVEKLHELQLSANRQTENYYMRSVEATKFQISVDLYQFTGPNGEYVDIATLRELPQFNGGNLRYYRRFNDAGDGTRLYSDIQRELTRETGWEAVMRMRISSGYTVRNYIGSFHRRSRDLLSIPVCHSDTNIVMDLLLKNPDVALKGNVAYVQAALLYTTSNGERRIRIHNLPIPIASNTNELWNGVNMSITINWIARQAALRLTVTPLARGRITIQEALTNVCRSYTAQSRRRLLTAQDYPQTWCTWPLMTLGMLKSLAFRDEPLVSVDVRSAIFAYLWSASPQATDLLFRPSVYPLHELLHDDTLGLWTEDNVVMLPPEAPNAFELLHKDGLYLLNDSHFIILWCGNQLSPEIVEELFFVSTRTGSRFPNVQGLTLRPPNDEGQNPVDAAETLLARIWNVIDYLRSLNPGRAQQVIACCSQTHSEVTAFTYRLYEDRTANVMGYSEFMTYLDKNSPASTR